MAARKRKAPSDRKLFVLDTNVLMHDPTSIFRFQEHDVFVPMMTLEELDSNKKGLTEVARNARQASRFMEELVAGMEHNLHDGVSLSATSKEQATGRFIFTNRSHYQRFTGTTTNG
nr:PIN domain-containing protein [Deefgea sp. CFH1-16]